MTRLTPFIAAALLAAAAAASAPASAQVVGECEGFVANARNVDWTQPSRTYGNGDIRLVVLDTEEPAAAAFHLMVLFPDREVGFQDCRIASLAAQGGGYAGIDLGAAIATYDPATGLTVELPVVVLDGDGEPAPETLTVTINRATGEVTAR